MRLIVVLMVCAAFVGGCSYVNRQLGMNDDNIIEEAIENKIEQATGLNIDLTPDSPEK